MVARHAPHAGGQVDGVQHLGQAVLLRRIEAEEQAGRHALVVLSASSRFSKTLSYSNTVGFWNLRPMPKLAISGSLWRSRSMVLPKYTVPWSGRVFPVPCACAGRLESPAIVAIAARALIG